MKDAPSTSPSSYSIAHTDQHHTGYVPPLSGASSSFGPRPLIGDDDPAQRLPLKPSLKLLFSLSSKRELWLFVFPSVVGSIATAILTPWMTIIMGRAMNSYTRFYESGDRSRLMHEQLVIFVTLLITAAVIVASHAFVLMLWNVHAEYVARRLRIKMFNELSEKSLEWFDLGMGGSDTAAFQAQKKESQEKKGDKQQSEKEEGSKDEDQGENKEESSSAAGLAGRFARDIDNVRTALGQVMGLTVELLSVALFCLILSFYRSYKLTFVMLITFPLVVIMTGLVEKWTGPLVQVNRATTGDASAKVERTTSAIATVKAFNAETGETDRFLEVGERMKRNYNKLTMLWGLRLGVAQFFLLMSFVQGFWYGNVLVDSGELDSGAVTEIFWATFLASTSLQSVIPWINAIETGKQGMAGLLNLLRKEPQKESGLPTPPQSAATASFDYPPKSPGVAGAPISPTIRRGPSIKRSRRKSASRPRNLRRIQPETFSGELALHHVTFHYPTRPHPHPPVLQDVSMFLPAQETTFIVGQSGSGKSTIGSLLMNLYEAEIGHIEADEQGIEWLDNKWLRSHIGMVSQGAAVLFDGTVHDNVAIGAVTGVLSEDPVKRAEQLSAVSRERVMAACRAALVHDFIRDLPDGYDTFMSGQKGASLSGGQRQRLAIARAYLRDPTVLILGLCSDPPACFNILLTCHNILQMRPLPPWT